MMMFMKDSFVENICACVSEGCNAENHSVDGGRVLGKGSLVSGAAVVVRSSLCKVLLYFGVSVAMGPPGFTRLQQLLQPLAPPHPVFALSRDSKRDF